MLPLELDPPALRLAPPSAAPSPASILPLSLASPLALASFSFLAFFLSSFNFSFLLFLEKFISPEKNPPDFEADVAVSGGGGGSGISPGLECFLLGAMGMWLGSLLLGGGGGGALPEPSSGDDCCSTFVLRWTSSTVSHFLSLLPTDHVREGKCFDVCLRYS